MRINLVRGRDTNSRQKITKDKRKGYKPSSKDKKNTKDTKDTKDTNPR